MKTHFWTLFEEKNIQSPNTAAAAVAAAAAEIGLFLDNQVNTIIADALAPCIARLSATIVWTLQNKQILVIGKEGFQLSTPTLTAKL